MEIKSKKPFEILASQVYNIVVEAYNLEDAKKEAMKKIQDGCEGYIKIDDCIEFYTKESDSE